MGLFGWCKYLRVSSVLFWGFLYFASFSVEWNIRYFFLVKDMFLFREKSIIIIIIIIIINFLLLLKICSYLEKKKYYYYYYYYNYYFYFLFFIFFVFQELWYHKIFREIGSSILLLVDGNFLSIFMVYMRVTTSN